MADKVLKLTRGQIQEFVGNDLSKIRVIENLITNAIIQDEIVSGIRVTRWASGRMEMYPESPTSSSGGSVEYPKAFYTDPDNPVKPNITAGENFSISVNTTTGFTWSSTVTTEHMWRVIGRWK